MLIARLPVSKMCDSERILLTLCRTKLVARKDFGSEYFEGNVSKMVGLLVMVALMFPVTPEA